ncbi:IS3 family transposase, partial [Vibrio parahaemolyticus]|nr:IS3 family transposase [Vibrio parahaemolyticus]
IPASDKLQKRDKKYFINGLMTACRIVGISYEELSTIIDSMPKSPTFKDLDEQLLIPTYQKWVTDITYIWVKSRWLFLATVMDLHSRRIVGWSLGTTMTVELITNALKMAFESRKPPKGVIIHSDRGVQYRAYKYQDFMRKHGGVPSMSRQGNCWDDAVMESFYSRLKVELIYVEDYQTVEEARMGIFEYIEVLYNRRRRHSALGHVSPVEYESM